MKVLAIICLLLSIYGLIDGMKKLKWINLIHVINIIFLILYLV